MQEYTYSDTGNLAKKVTIDNDGDRFEAEYNADGKPVKETMYKADGSVYDWSEFEYHTNGILMKEKRLWSEFRGFDYSEDGERIDIRDILGHYEKEYDEKGNLVKETYYDTDGNVTESK